MLDDEIRSASLHESFAMASNEQASINGGGGAAVTAAAAVDPMAITDEDNGPPRRSRLRRVAILASLFSTLFASALNSTSIATAIPTIAHDLHSSDGYSWISGAFLLSNTASGPIWANLSSIWGRKTILLMAVAGFMLSSMICALAVDITMLIVGRCLQGMSAGGMMQMVTIVISDLFSVRHRSFYLAMLQVVWCVANGVGPVLGGAFAQHLSWTWAFWIMIPPSACAFLLLFVFLDVHNPRTGLREGLLAVDWAGSVSIIALLVMLLLGLNFGGVDFPWDSPVVICLLVFGVLTTVCFAFSEKFARYPLMPLHLFQQKSNLASLLIAFTQDFAFFSGQYYVPLFLQAVMLQSPTNAGALVLSYSLTASVIGIFVGIYIHRTGRYVEILWVGQGLMIIGFALFNLWSIATPISQICGILFVAGSGVGMLFAPPLIALQARTSQKDTASATVALGVTRAVSVVLAVVVGQAILDNGMNTQAANLKLAGLSPTLLESFSGANAASNLGLLASLSDPVSQAAVKKAFAESLKPLWILDTCLVAAGFLSTVLIEKTHLSEEHTETRTGIEKRTQSMN